MSHILIMKYYKDNLNVIHVRGLTNNFVIKTNKCPKVKIIFLHRVHRTRHVL